MFGAQTPCSAPCKPWDKRPSALSAFFSNGFNSPVWSVWALGTRLLRRVLSDAAAGTQFGCGAVSGHGGDASRMPTALILATGMSINKPGQGWSRSSCPTRVPSQPAPALPSALEPRGAGHLSRKPRDDRYRIHLMLFNLISCLFPDFFSPARCPGMSGMLSGCFIKFGHHFPNRSGRAVMRERSLPNYSFVFYSYLQK